MQQLTCLGPNKLEWHEVPEPRIAGDGEALVRPLAVARCDIDRFLASGLFPLRGPFALGHECVGEVIALGDAVRGLAIGQRVVVSFQVSCGRCPRCAAGLTALCEKLPTLSDYGMQPLSGVEYGGMLSDLIRVPYAEAMLQPLPAGLEPAALASVSDNVLDGYRAVAPHLAAHPQRGPDREPRPAQHPGLCGAGRARTGREPGGLRERGPRAAGAGGEARRAPGGDRLRQAGAQLS